jgi:transposase
MLKRPLRVISDLASVGADFRFASKSRHRPSRSAMAQPQGLIYPAVPVRNSAGSGLSANADRGYDADWFRDLTRQQGAWTNIPPKTKSQRPDLLQPYLYRVRNLIERFFNKIKQCRRVATRQTRSQLSGVRQTRTNPGLATCQ